ncbi:MAG TPA: HIT domain-containing protein [Clostridia bacterium]|nr:HIT domain-containing protein [Clostridia bacterium]
MQEDVFCKIVKGQIPAYKIWEDENYLAFLDVNPKSQGHSLVIPKAHYRWVFEVPDFGEYFEKVKVVEQKLQKAFAPDFVEIWVLGIDVSHAHVHLIPHYQKAPAKKELEQLAKEIKEAPIL